MLKPLILLWLIISERVVNSINDNLKKQVDDKHKPFIVAAFLLGIAYGIIATYLTFFI